MTPCKPALRAILATVPLAAAVALAGCSESSTNSAPAGPPALADLMTRASCTDSLVAEQSLTREAADCTIGGRQVSVATFDNLDQREQWKTFVEGTGYPVVTKGRELWAVSGQDEEGAEAFAEAVG